MTCDVYFPRMINFTVTYLDNYNSQQHPMYKMNSYIIVGYDYWLCNHCKNILCKNITFEFWLKSSIWNQIKRSIYLIQWKYGVSRAISCKCISSISKENNFVVKPRYYSKCGNDPWVHDSNQLHDFPKIDDL